MEASNSRTPFTFSQLRQKIVKWAKGTKAAEPQGEEIVFASTNCELPSATNELASNPFFIQVVTFFYEFYRMQSQHTLNQAFDFRGRPPILAICGMENSVITNDTVLPLSVLRNCSEPIRNSDTNCLFADLMGIIYNQAPNTWNPACDVRRSLPILPIRRIVIPSDISLEKSMKTNNLKFSQLSQKIERWAKGTKAAEPQGQEIVFASNTCEFTATADELVSNPFFIQVVTFFYEFYRMQSQHTSDRAFDFRGRPPILAIYGMENSVITNETVQPLSVLRNCSEPIRNSHTNCLFNDLMSLLYNQAPNTWNPFCDVRGRLPILPFRRIVIPSDISLEKTMKTNNLKFSQLSQKIYHGQKEPRLQSHKEKKLSLLPILANSLQLLTN